MQPPMSPAQLAAQKYELVESFEDLVKGGLGEQYPVITLVTTGKAPEEAPAKIEYGRAAVAAFLASHLASAPPADMTKVPLPVLKVKYLDNVTITEFRTYAPWIPYSTEYIPFARSQRRGSLEYTPQEKKQA